MQMQTKKHLIPPGSPLRLVCIGDTHGFHRRLKLPSGDILIHSGDFMVYGSSVDEVDDFNDWLKPLPFRHKLVIAGNHDRLFDRNPGLARSHLTAATYLQDSGVSIEGLKFWGSPVTTTGNNWAFSREPAAKVREHWDAIPDETDVLITHEPPYGTLDQPRTFAKHAGCQYLLGAVLRIKPRLHIFGHVHGAYGHQTMWDEVLMVNCAMVDNNRRLANIPLIVEVER